MRLYAEIRVFSLPLSFGLPHSAYWCFATHINPLDYVYCIKQFRCAKQSTAGNLQLQQQHQHHRTFIMSDRKAVIKNADMSEEMQQDAVDSATQAMEKFNIEKVC